MLVVVTPGEFFFWGGRRRRSVRKPEAAKKKLKKIHSWTLNVKKALKEDTRQEAPDRKHIISESIA